jgi:hypothetical protein
MHFWRSWARRGKLLAAPMNDRALILPKMFRIHWKVAELVGFICLGIASRMWSPTGWYLVFSRHEKSSPNARLPLDQRRELVAWRADGVVISLTYYIKSAPIVPSHHVDFRTCTFFQPIDEHIDISLNEILLLLQRLCGKGMGDTTPHP